MVLTIPAVVKGLADCPTVSMRDFVRDLGVLTEGDADDPLE